MKTSDFALGGLLTALGIIFLYLSAVFSTNTLTFLTLASFMVPICVLRSSTKTAFYVYISTSILSFFMTPLNIAFLYTAFFGIYGLIKYFIEKQKILTTEILLKLVFFNSVFFIFLSALEKLSGFNLFKNLHLFFVKNLPNASSLLISALVWLLSQVGFIIYDYALTLLIGYYHDYFPKSRNR